MRAFEAVTSWARAWKVEAAPAGLPAPSAAYVWIRLDGRALGRGSDVAANAAGDAACIARAAGAAIEDARKHAPIERDALFEESLKTLSPRLAITLELAGPLIPFAPREPADIASAVNFGVEGVAVRMGDRLAAMFPEQMLVTSTEPSAAAGALVSKLGADPTLGLKKPSELAAERGVAYYRFKTATVGHPRAGAAPLFLQRAGRVVGQADTSEAELRRWADELAASLVRRVWASTRDMSVEYEPLRGALSTDAASVAQTLLCAFSLNGYSSLSRLSRKSADEALQVSKTIYDRCFERGLEVRDDAPLDLPGLTLAQLIFQEGRGAPAVDMIRLVGAGVETQRLFDGNGVAADSVVEGERGFLALKAATAGRDESMAEKVVRVAFRRTTPGQLVGEMPWLGMAELEMHPTGDVPSALALREMRSMVWQHQLKAEDLAPDQQDLAGGIVFTASKQPLPTWQAARPLAFIATMLGDERLTDDKEVPAELSRLLASLRFLRQLTADEAAGHMYAEPARALGGVRVSLWDQRMPPEATAMTLLTVCETLQSLEKIKARQAAKAAPPGGGEPGK